MKLGIRRYRYRPLFLAMIFSLFTIYLYEFGVVDFRGKDKILLYVFLLYAHIAMIFGYYCGIHSKSSINNPQAYDGQFLLREIYKVAFITYLITFIPAFMVETHTYRFSVSDMITKIQIGLANSASLYNDNRSVQSVTGIWRIINFGLVLTGFIRWTFFPLSVYLWDKIKNYQKVFFFIFALFYLAGYLATGTTAGIFTITFIIVVPFLMKSFRRKYYDEIEHGRKRKSRRARFASILFVIAGIFASLWVFSNNMESRMGWYRITGDWSAFPWLLIPVSMRPSVYWITGYVAQGYEALSYCIDLPFTPTFGVGGSWFLISNFSSLFRTNILEYTFLGKAEQFGIGAYRNWHTVYVWLANDVSFIGVPFVLFALFYLMAQSWRDYLKNNDPFAFIFVTIMGFFCLYISANNTVFTHSDTLFAFWIVLYSWKKLRKKYKYE